MRQGLTHHASLAIFFLENSLNEYQFSDVDCLCHCDEYFSMWPDSYFCYRGSKLTEESKYYFELRNEPTMLHCVIIMCDHMR